MPAIKDILSEKGSSVLSIGRNATVLEAAEKMNEHRVGSVLVVEGDRIEGIFTERDVLRRVVAAQLDPAKTRVEQVMTKELACCRPETSVDEARSFMRNKKIRHLPVIDDDDKLHGLISIGDLNAYRLEGQEQTISYLHQYLYGQT
jgi:CBS domain-containing protein